MYKGMHRYSAPVLDVTASVGSANTFLAMFMVGVMLTLSTCLDEDRLVILARRQREGENKASLREIVNMAVRQ